jgi:hypothetical protein
MMITTASQFAIFLTFIANAFAGFFLKIRSLLLRKSILPKKRYEHAGDASEGFKISTFWITYIVPSRILGDKNLAEQLNFFSYRYCRKFEAVTKVIHCSKEDAGLLSYVYFAYRSGISPLVPYHRLV